ncbi:TPA: hypothetical protein IGZ61_002256 [Escherichia coli]|nr:hypothetical protein [Escherichia coli]
MAIPLIPTLAATLLQAGPAILRTVGGWFGDGVAKVADNVADMVEAVTTSTAPTEQQRTLERWLQTLPPEQLAQLSSLHVQLEQITLDRDQAVLADRQATHREQQDTIRNGDNAASDYVRRTRPLMARLSLYAGAAYVLILTLGQISAAALTAYGHPFTAPTPDWDIALMLLTPALGYLGFRTLDGFAPFSKSGKDKARAA